MSLEHLALLTPSSPGFEVVSKGTGNTAITRDDVAQALAMCPRINEILLRYVYLEDLVDLDVLIAGVVREIKRFDDGLFMGQRWTNALKKLVPMSLERIASPSLCRVCKGRREIFDGVIVVDCEECLGTGKHVRTDAAMANKIGVTRETYNRTWKNRYNAVDSHIAGLLTDSEVYFRKNLQRH